MLKKASLAEFIGEYYINFNVQSVRAHIRFEWLFATIHRRVKFSFHKTEITPRLKSKLIKKGEELIRFEHLPQRLKFAI